MSGIYIKGMEMPTSCSVCWALDDYGDYPRCRITEEQRGYNFPIRQKRMDNCPLVPVPPHGRLIDADALMTLFERREHMVYEFGGDEFDCSFLSASQKPSTEWDCVEDILENAPTIIPPSGGKEDE